MRRRKITVTALAVLLVMLMLLPVGCVPVGNKVAVVSLSGSISSGGTFPLFGSSITPGLVRQQLDRAASDVSVRAVVIRVNSPGGVVAPCQEILKEVEKLRQWKPVVISMGDMATSGGYYISVGADRIVALPGTMTGSIGVILQIPNTEGLYEKLGVDMQVFTADKYKDMYAGLRKLTPEEEEISQAMVDTYYEQFVDVVAEGRGMSRDRVRDLATGQIYTGVRAKELGLIDELGGLDTAIDLAAELAGVMAPAVEYYESPSKSLLELLLGADLSSLARAVELRLMGLSAQDMVLLQALSYSSPEPQYLVSPASLS